MNLLNPKTALFFFAFLPQFVRPGHGPVAQQMLTLGLLFMTMAMSTDALYALAAGRAARWLRRNEAFTRRSNYVTGTVYLGLGIAAAAGGGSAPIDLLFGGLTFALANDHGRIIRRRDRPSYSQPAAWRSRQRVHPPTEVFHRWLDRTGGVPESPHRAYPIVLRLS